MGAGVGAAIGGVGAGAVLGTGGGAVGIVIGIKAVNWWKKRKTKSCRLLKHKIRKSTHF